MAQSNAFSGVGTTFSRSSAGSSGGGTSYSTIAEINNIDGPSMSRDTIDVTSLDSTGGYREFIASFRDGGEVTLDMNFTRDGYVDMKDDFESDSKVWYKITLNDTGNTELEFEGLVTALGVAIPMDDKVTASVTIKISGQVYMHS